MFLRGMPSSLAILAWGIFGTLYALFIMFSFSDLESHLLFMPVLDVASSRRCLIKSTKKYNKLNNFKSNSLKHSVQQQQKKQSQQFLD